MPSPERDDVFGLFDDYDPLDADDDVIDQDAIDDDNPYDTVDFPTMRTMPESLRAEKSDVYTPERQGGAFEALAALMDRNPARRPVMLAILQACEGGMAASELSARVDALQQDNRSVYAPMTLARMLQRAGGLALDMPEASVCHEDGQGGAYLTIEERIDPVWTTTDAGRAVRESLSNGDAFRRIVLEHDEAYREVYRAVMQAIEERPRGKAEIDELVDSFAIAAEPRRFGGHFIDVLEQTDAISWKNGAWTLSDLGARMIASLKD